MAEIRAKVMSLMRRAIVEGRSRTSFLKDMKAQELMYVRKRMIADWSSLTERFAKAGALTKLGRDVFPGTKSTITTQWDIAGEFMYVVKVKSRVSPEQPVTERFVNIVTDAPMTPRMIEQAVVEKWKEWREEYREELEEITPYTAIRTTL